MQAMFGTRDIIIMVHARLSADAHCLETSAVWLVADADACVAGGAMRLMAEGFPLGLQDQLPCASRGP